jgi:hypothetical protein
MSLREFTILLYDISEYAYGVVGILALWKLLRTKKYFHLTLFLLVVAALRIASIYLADEGMNTMPIYHFIGLLELTFAYFIYIKHDISKYWKYTIALLCIFYILNSATIISLTKMPSFALALVQLTILGLGINCLHSLYTKSEIKNLSKQPFFYINAGFMIYAAGSFFVNLMSSEIIKDGRDDFFHNAWIIEALVGIVRLLLIAFAFRFVKRDR